MCAYLSPYVKYTWATHTKNYICYHELCVSDKDLCINSWNCHSRWGFGDDFNTDVWLPQLLFTWKFLHVFASLSDNIRPTRSFPGSPSFLLCMFQKILTSFYVGMILSLNCPNFTYAPLQFDHSPTEIPEVSTFLLDTYIARIERIS